MSDERKPEKILASAEVEAQEAMEQQRGTTAAKASHRQLDDAIRRVSDFTAADLRRELARDPADQEFLECWAERIVALGRVFSERGLVERFDEVPAGPKEKAFALEIFKLGCSAHPERIVRLLTDAERLSQPPAPSFSGRVNYWLRCGLIRELLDLQAKAGMGSGTVLSPSGQGDAPSQGRDRSEEKVDHQEFKWRPVGPEKPDVGKESEASSNGERKSPPTAENVWRKEGEIWTVAFEGKSVRLRDRVGLTYIAELLSKQGRDLSAGQLLVARRGKSVPKASGGTEVSDQQASDAYRERYEDLSSELEEARTNQDKGRQEKIQLDMNTLLQEMQAAEGFGGRKRQLGDEGERQRKAVQMAISRIVDALERKHPDLGRHLLKSIRMGRCLSYMPGADFQWQF